MHNKNLKHLGPSWKQGVCSSFLFFFVNATLFLVFCSRSHHVIKQTLQRICFVCTRVYRESACHMLLWVWVSNGLNSWACIHALTNACTHTVSVFSERCSSRLCRSPTTVVFWLCEEKPSQLRISQQSWQQVRISQYWWQQGTINQYSWQQQFDSKDSAALSKAYVTSASC